MKYNKPEQLQEEISEEGRTSGFPDRIRTIERRCDEFERSLLVYVGYKIYSFILVIRSIKLQVNVLR